MTPEALAEARQLIARLAVLLGDEAPPAIIPAPSEGVPKVGLRDVDYADAAATIGCDVAAVKAVYEVESNGKAFGFDGRPTLLFEPHKFSEFTGNRFDATHGGVSYPRWGQKPYPTGTADQRHTANWDRLLYAARLDRDAAYKSASYGAPQIMGFNYADCAFSTVHEFAVAMGESERRQLNTFVQLIVTWKLDDEMRERRWADFARRYNGPKFAVNRYDTKLAAAYARHA